MLQNFEVLPLSLNMYQKLELHIYVYYVHMHIRLTFGILSIIYISVYSEIGKTYLQQNYVQLKFKDFRKCNKS